MITLTDDKRLQKNEKIRSSGKATREKRKSQICRVFKVKVDVSRLSAKQKEHLKMIFTEAKWLYNDILQYSENNDINTYNTKTKFVNVLNKNKEVETRELKYISARMKQSVLAGIQSSIKSLSRLKKNGRKVGRLKYISDYRSIDLMQYGWTYKIHGKNRIKIQNVPGRVIVNGLEQFIDTPNIEIANAKLLNTPSGYYIAITTYTPKEDIKPREYIDKEIGVDMGIKNHITLSNGEKFSASVGETERLKRLQRKLSRQVKGSNNRRKTLRLIQREYQKLTNRKNDIANKLVAYILSYEKIYMQDEQLSNWQKGLFGKQIQYSILGKVKAKLINNPRVEVLDRSVPTTKFCPVCQDTNNDIQLGDDIYTCPTCGYTEDRDIHAARNMIIMCKIVKNNLPRGPREVTPAETVKSTVVETGRLQPVSCG